MFEFRELLVGLTYLTPYIGLVVTTALGMSIALRIQDWQHSKRRAREIVLRLEFETDDRLRNAHIATLQSLGTVAKRVVRKQLEELRRRGEKYKAREFLKILVRLGEGQARRELEDRLLKELESKSDDVVRGALSEIKLLTPYLDGGLLSRKLIGRLQRERSPYLVRDIAEALGALASVEVLDQLVEQVNVRLKRGESHPARTILGLGIGGIVGKRLDDLTPAQLDRIALTVARILESNVVDLLHSSCCIVRQMVERWGILQVGIRGRVLQGLVASLERDPLAEEVAKALEVLVDEVSRRKELYNRVLRVIEDAREDHPAEKITHLTRLELKLRPELVQEMEQS